MRPAARSRPPAVSTECDRRLSSLIGLLGSLADQIDVLGDEDYRARPAGRLSGSVGGHVRHCLDHVDALVRAAATGELNYEARTRGTPVEHSPAAALDEIDRLEHALRHLPGAALDRSINVRLLVDEEGTEVATPSTLARELAYVISHTIHHCAVMALLMGSLNVRVASRFGYAPGTPDPASVGPGGRGGWPGGQCGEVFS
jgi:uncharacterized damage-inducible protein DinB